jgi:multidrug efflux pump subunit AcrA (membrane-fusion protein)
MTKFLRGRWRWLILLLLATVGAAVIYQRAYRAMDLSDPARARSQGRPIPVRTAAVTCSVFEQVIGATAVTTGSGDAVIRAVAPGQGTNTVDMIIKAIHVREGDRVRQGQLLFELTDEIRQAALQRAQVSLAAIEAEQKRVAKAVAFNDRMRQLELDCAEAHIRFRKEELQTRTEALELVGKLAQSNTLSQLELFEARSKRDAARAEVKEAERRLQAAKDGMQVGPLQDEEILARSRREVRAAQLDVESAQRDLHWCQVTSPIDGFVDNKVDVSVGQVLTVTSSLARVVNLDPIHLRLDFPQERLDEIAVGQDAEITLDSFPKETFAGKVIRISPVVNPALRVTPVVVELKNPDNRIKAGISGFVRLRAKRQAVAVPAAAVIQHGSKAMVFRIENGRARMREVKVKHLLELGMLEVADGLAPGDEVVVYFSNFYRHWRELSSKECYLQDNDPVDVDWKKWTRRGE